MATFWKIEEAVGAGRYIVLEGTYATREGAEREIARLPSNGGMRAARYETGRTWGAGPQRAE